MKVCKDCKQELSLNNFTKDSKGYYRSYCKPCSSKRAVVWAKENRERVYKRNKEWRDLQHEIRPEEYREYVRKRSLAQQKRDRANGKRPNPVTVEQKRAYWKVCNLRRKGLLIPPIKCPKCGFEGRMYGHHKDYNQPEVIDWMCQRCHSLEHMENKKNVSI